MSEASTLAVGDRVKFLGVDASSEERQEAEVTGTEGAWAMLQPGAIGTVNSVVPGHENRLFVNFEGVAMPLDGIALLLGQPTGWPVLASEVEKVDA